MLFPTNLRFVDSIKQSYSISLPLLSFAYAWLAADKSLLNEKTLKIVLTSQSVGGLVRVLKGARVSHRPDELVNSNSV